MKPSAVQSYFASVQAFRGVAAVLVLLFHIDLACRLKWGFSYFDGLFAFGYCGISFFFVLSGFIIFTIHEKDLGKPQQFNRYLRKRVIRIYPTYWLILTIFILGQIVLPQFANEKNYSVWRVLASYALFPQDNLPILGVAWTLVFEVFFYLLFGLFILFSFKRIFLCLVLLFLFWSALSVYRYYLVLQAGHEVWVFPWSFIFNAYHFNFLMGILVAVLLKRIQCSWTTIYGGLVFTVVLFFLTVACEEYLQKKLTSLHSVFTYGTLSAFLLFFTLQWEKRKKVVIPRSIELVGDASYVLYLVHVPAITVCFVLLPKVFPLNEMSVVVKTFGATLISIFLIVFSIVFYRSLEEPLLLYLRKKFLISNKG